MELTSGCMGDEIVNKSVMFPRDAASSRSPSMATRLRRSQNSETKPVPTLTRGVHTVAVSRSVTGHALHARSHIRTRSALRRKV